ncbi:hypothetical protein EVJ58_g11087, partial [Rhodofomes roseus]
MAPSRSRKYCVQGGDILPPTVAVSEVVSVRRNGRARIVQTTQHRAQPPAPKRARVTRVPPIEASQPAAPNEPESSNKADAVSEEGATTESAGASKQGRTVKNGISKVLADWRPRFTSMLEDILEGELPPNVGAICSCGKAAANVRCRDFAPFHWIERWNGRCLEKQDLGELGLVLYLGHGGLRCPCLPEVATPIVYTVTHINGIHRVPIHHCCCPRARDSVSQLLRLRLFPATLERPESAFSFELLRQWDLHFLTSKKGTYDFYEALRRLTDNSGTRTVKNRYRELNLAGRIWQHLTSLKRSGLHHGLSLPNRPVSVTVPCFACPWPGFNLPPNWRDTPSELAYIHGCELGGDGNHGLQKKRKRDDPADTSLAEGQGFFVDPAKTKDYLEEIAGDVQWIQGRAAQRPGKFRNLEVSGVVAVICIRHGCFRPGAMVDLQKGERYGHMDFALAGALAGLEELMHFIFTYDVVCIYSVNLRKRFGERFPHLVPLLDRMQMLLPKLHMLAHEERCQILYALCYSWGAGLSHGESVEHPWAEHNQVGLSTREMSAGHRHDALNAIHNHWNWCKMETAKTYLARKLKEAFKV